MDPLTAIGLVSNIVGFIEISTKLIKGTKEVHLSLLGKTEENQSLEMLMLEMKAFSSKLLTPEDAAFMGNDKQLCKLAEECRKLSTQLVELLNKIRAKDPKSKRSSVWSAIKNKYYERDKQDMEQRLSNCGLQLNLQLSFLISQDVKARLNNLLAASQVNTAQLETLHSSIDRIRHDGEAWPLSSETQNHLQQLSSIQEEALAIVSQDRILNSLKFEEIHGRFDTVDEAHYNTFKWILNSKSGFEDLMDSSTSEMTTESDDEDLTLDENSELAQSITSQSFDGSNSRDERQTNKHDGYEKINDQLNHVGLSDHGVEEHQEVRSGTDGNCSDESLQYRYNHLNLEVEKTKSLARQKLLNWLARGEGIFHISGKLGSGKSTLMKFLCTQRATQTELRKWAGSRTLVFASFFFWKPGTSRQKSLAGLYRGLLYSVLKACPDLVAQVFPKIWATTISAPWQMQPICGISDKDARDAFNRLIKNQSLGEKHAFCFFIDGLDEFEETTQQDHKDIVELLYSWADTTPSNVKLCVSSREYNVFMNTFSSDTRLRLHELTRGDMEVFIQDKLGHLPNPFHRNELVIAIVEKAHGIFLWVALVTKSIRDQLENGATIFQMKRELDILPDEMDSLYEHILHSLNYTNRKRAYQTFRMLDEVKNYSKIFISLFAYSFLDEYEQESEFAMKDDFKLRICVTAKHQRVEDAQKRLRGCCKGLVEQNSLGVLDYTHRSVAEFLQSTKIRGLISSMVADFNALEVISQLLLAELRFRTVTNSEELQHSRNESQHLLVMRSEKGLDQPPYPFLSCLETTLDPIPWEYLSYGASYCNFHLSSYHTTGTTIVCVNNSRPESDHKNHWNNFILHAPLYVLTSVGYHDYPIWKILHDPSATDTMEKTIVLMYCLLKSKAKAPLLGPYMFELLLERGLVRPSTKTHLSLVRYKKCDDISKLTVWHHCLIYIFLWHRISEVERGPDIICGQILEIFLQRDVDLNFAFTLKPIVEDLKGRIIRPAVIKYGPDLSESIEIETNSWYGRTQSFRSLREWIENVGLVNKGRLLQLYDAQMEKKRAANNQEKPSEIDVNTRV